MNRIGVSFLQTHTFEQNFHDEIEAGAVIIIDGS